MLAAQGAAELQNEVRDVLHDGAHARHVGGVLEVEHRADVQTADAGVRVKASFRPMLSDDLLETGNIGRQLFGCDGGIFDKRCRLAIADHAKQQPLPGIANLPYVALPCGIRYSQEGVPQSGSAQPALHLIQSRFQFCSLVARILHKQ